MNLLAPLSVETDRRRIPRMGYAGKVFAFFPLRGKCALIFKPLISMGCLPRAVAGLEAGTLAMRKDRRLATVVTNARHW